MNWIELKLTEKDCGISRNEISKVHCLNSEEFNGTVYVKIRLFSAILAHFFVCRKLQFFLNTLGKIPLTVHVYANKFSYCALFMLFGSQVAHQFSFFRPEAIDLLSTWPQYHEAILDWGQNLYAFYKFNDNIQSKFETWFRFVFLSCCYLHTSSKNLVLISFGWMTLGLSLRLFMIVEPAAYKKFNNELCTCRFHLNLTCKFDILVS